MPGRDLEARILEQAMEFVQDHRVRRQQADLQTRFAIRFRHVSNQASRITRKGQGGLKIEFHNSHGGRAGDRQLS